MLGSLNHNTRENKEVRSFLEGKMKTGIIGRESGERGDRREGSWREEMGRR